MSQPFDLFCLDDGAGVGAAETARGCDALGLEARLEPSPSPGLVPGPVPGADPGSLSALPPAWPGRAPAARALSLRRNRAEDAAFAAAQRRALARFLGGPRRFGVVLAGPLRLSPALPWVLERLCAHPEHWRLVRLCPGPALAARPLVNLGGGVRLYVSQADRRAPAAVLYCRPCAEFLLRRAGGLERPGSAQPWGAVIARYGLAGAPLLQLAPPIVDPPELAQPAASDRAHPWWARFYRGRGD